MTIMIKMSASRITILPDSRFLLMTPSHSDEISVFVPLTSRGADAPLTGGKFLVQVVVGSVCRSIDPP